MKRLATWCFVLTAAASTTFAQGTEGYYRFPAIHGDQLVFTAEGDLWGVGIEGGSARRLTTHPGEEIHPAISPDGTTVAFSAAYEGPMEVYAMPVSGGLPVRLTWEGAEDDRGAGSRGALVVGWTPGGRILYSTGAYSGLPSRQLATLDPATGERVLLPLAQAADGTYDPTGESLFFTRLPFQGSHAKRYQGGTAQSLWRLTAGEPEAVALTADYPGTSKEPMWWQDRAYFVSDRDGTMNLWSMEPSGGDLRQHTHHEAWDVQRPALSGGRIVYQLGADLRLYDVATAEDRKVAIDLVSDFDQSRERWIDEPMEYLTDAHLSPSGDRVALTARGEVFVAPVGTGRLVHVTRRSGTRFRSAHFLAGGGSLLALSDESGEVEWWELAANGAGERRQVTSDGHVWRFDGVPSPDGSRIATVDQDAELWVHDTKTGEGRRIAVSPLAGFASLTWSPDSRWLAYSMVVENSIARLFLYDSRSGASTPLTSDRFDSWYGAFDAAGEWLYFASNRHFESVVGNPWGPRQPDPYFDEQTELFALALSDGLRFPFRPDDELMEPAGQEEGEVKAAAADPSNGNGKRGKKEGAKESAKPEVPEVKIELAGIEHRLFRLPVPPGNYTDLAVAGKRLFWTSSTNPNWAGRGKQSLMVLEIGAKKPEAASLADEIEGFELSADGKKLLVQKKEKLFVIDAGASAPAKLDDAAVDLSGWTFPLDPRAEWRQMLADAWRLHRDYFYDRGMHGLDWPAVEEKYLPLVDRVTTRNELGDLEAQMISELSALHQFVRGGDFRKGPEDIEIATLGALLERDSAAGGYRVARIYASDPDLPGDRPPLAEPGVGVSEGDVVLAVNGVATLERPPGASLRGQAGRQVRLRVASKNGSGSASSARARDVIVVPISASTDRDLRYNEWEYTRRLQVEGRGEGRLGYLHLRAMSSGDVAQWERDYYPVFNRQGLVIDVRHNRGGNIDSWILGKLLRKAWFYWQARTGQPYWNMQFAFRGHLVVLIDEFTASDGEAFAEGFRRLGLGPVIGTRTWGGEIWLTGSNRQVDRGVATAPEFGVYGPEGEWLIEGHGVDPDLVVDNLPRATFEGGDAQLDAAVSYLLEQIDKDPRPVPPPPAYRRLGPVEPVMPISPASPLPAEGTGDSPLDATG
jgi:tricorn protease